MVLSFVREGVLFAVLIFAVGGLFAYFGAWAVAAFFALFGLFTLYFFRNPRAVVPLDESLVVSPASGRVTDVKRVESPSGGTLVSILLSVFDVHVTRSPISGVVKDVAYMRGKKLVAKSPRAIFENECNSITVSGKVDVVVTQMAGIVARRIVCWVAPGGSVERGRNIGMIRFGSRTNILLPEGVEVLVKVGDRVESGSTPVGRIIGGAGK
jgi:phosphatidylserine decarboxylase